MCNLCKPTIKSNDQSKINMTYDTMTRSYRQVALYFKHKMTRAEGGRQMYTRQYKQWKNISH